MEEDVRIRAVVKEGDFFSFSEEFDVGYDYTVCRPDENPPGMKGTLHARLKRYPCTSTSIASTAVRVRHAPRSTSRLGRDLGQADQARWPLGDPHLPCGPLEGPRHRTALPTYGRPLQAAPCPCWLCRDQCGSSSGAAEPQGPRRFRAHGHLETCRIALYTQCDSNETVNI